MLRKASTALAFRQLVETHHADLCPDVAVALHQIFMTRLEQLQHLGNVDADGA